MAFPEANIGFLIELYTGRIEASSPGTLPQGMAVADLGHSYAHILERRHGHRVDVAGRHFDATARRIQAGEFAVAALPEPHIYGECDLRTLCRAEGMIGGEAADGLWWTP